MKLVKKLSCVLVALLMILSASAVCFAEEENAPVVVKDPEGNDRQNLVDYVSLWSATKYSEPMMNLSDGNHGSNNSGDYNKSYGSGEKTTENQCEFSHRGDSTASVTGLPENKIEAAGVEYYYYVNAALKGYSKVTGLTMYLQGYKAAVMDHAIDILYSTDDGETWTKVVEAHNPFDITEVYHYENWDSTTGFGGTQYGSGAATDTTIEGAAWLYIDLEVNPLLDVTNVAWAVYSPRCNNAHYTSRMTEFEVYGEITAPFATEAPTEAPTAAPTEAPTQGEDQPTEAPTQAEDQPTQAPVNTNAPETKAAEEKKGCGSAVVPGMILCLAPAALVLRKKKED